MVRRRVKSKPLMADQESNQANVLENLSGLANLSGDAEEMDGLQGTAQPSYQPEDMIEFPQVPRNPADFEDQVGVDDVPGIPEGIELIGDLAEAESEEDALDYVGDPEPPTSLPYTSTGDLQDPFEFIKSRVQEEPELAQYLPQKTKDLIEQTSEAPQQMEAVQEEVIEAPSALPPAVQQLPEQGTGEMVAEDQIPQEGLGAMPGAVEAVQANPDLQRNVANLLKLQEGEVPKEAYERAQILQDALTKKENELNVTEKEYKAKLERGELSTLDKVALGIAISVPVIIGLVYGKDALINSLAGAAKGFGQAMQKQQDIDLKNLGKIGEIQKEKQSIEQERAKLKEEYLKNIENPAVRKLLKNYDVLNVTKGANGEPTVTIGKDAMIVGDTIGLNVGDESGVLWYDTNQIRDDDDVKNFKTAAKEGKIALGKMNDANKTIDDVVDIMAQIERQHPTLYNAVRQRFQPLLYTDEKSWMSIFPGSQQALTIEITGEDGKIRKVQALPVLRQKITALQDVYNKEYLGGNKLTSNMLKHWNDVFPDASAVASWLKADFNTMQQQAQNFKNTLNQRAVESLAGQGFLREPLEKVLPTKGGDILRSRAVDVEDIKQNPEKYREKVKGK